MTVTETIQNIFAIRDIKQAAHSWSNGQKGRALAHLSCGAIKVLGMSTIAYCSMEYLRKSLPLEVHVFSDTSKTAPAPLSHKETIFTCS